MPMLEQKGSPDLNKSPPFGTTQGFTSGLPGTKRSPEVPARKEEERTCLPEQGNKKKKKKKLEEEIGFPELDKYSRFFPILLWY